MFRNFFDVVSATVPDHFFESVQRGKPRIADFVHGSDGLGNIYLDPPKSEKCDKSAPEFLVDTVSKYPGEVSILALGPLTNIALVSDLLFVIDS